MQTVDDYSIWYFSTKRIGVIFGRELMLAGKCIKISNLDIFILTSVDYASSESQLFNVKALCYFYCFIVQEQGENCNLTVLFKDDPGGFFSKKVHSALVKRFMKQLLVLKSILETS